MSGEWWCSLKMPANYPQDQTSTANFVIILHTKSILKHFQKVLREIESKEKL